MKAVVFFALAFASPAWTLVAPSRPSSRQPSMSMAVAPRLKMKSPIPKALNPFDWSVDRPARPNKVEGAELYRMIGVAPEADYEEIKAKAAQLAVKYEKDPKRKIKIEVACDKIVELRLRQAAKGSLMMAGSAIGKNQQAARREKEANKVDLVPKSLKGLIVLPVPKARMVAGAKWIVAPGLAVAGLFPGLAPPMRAYVIIASLQMVYMRGRPVPSQEEQSMMGRHDMPTGAEFKKLVLLTAAFMFSAFGAAAAATLTPLFTWSPRFHLTVMTLFGYAQVCLCKIYTKNNPARKRKAAE